MIEEWKESVPWYARLLARSHSAVFVDMCPAGKDYSSSLRHVKIVPWRDDFLHCIPRHEKKKKTISSPSTQQLSFKLIIAAFNRATSTAWVCTYVTCHIGTGNNNPQTRCRAWTIIPLSGCGLEKLCFALSSFYVHPSELSAPNHVSFAALYVVVIISSLGTLLHVPVRMSISAEMGWDGSLVLECGAAAADRTAFIRKRGM